MTRLFLAKGTGLDPTGPKTSQEPWGVKLTRGYHCLALQGAHSQYGSSNVNFSCGHNVYLLDEPDRTHHVWTEASVIWKHDHFVRGLRLKLTVAWFPGRNPN